MTCAGTTRNTVFMVLVSILFMGASLAGTLDIRHGILFVALLGGFIAYNLHLADRQRRTGVQVADDISDQLVAGLPVKKIAIWLGDL